MKRLNFKDVIIPVFALTLICVIVTALLALTNSVTLLPIKENNEKQAQEARSRVLPSASTFEEKDTYYQALSDNGDTVGYVFEASAKGYGGDVSVMVGITLDGNVSGVEILSHNETPGLGANATNKEFTDEYKQPIPTQFSIVKDGTGGNNGNIDALTGATITSRAVTDAINSAIEQYKSITGGAKE